MNTIQTSPRSETRSHKITRWAAVLTLLIAVGVTLTVVLVSRAAQPESSVTATNPRYQISAFGNANGHGAYVLDMSTGEVWLVGEFPKKKITDKLQ